MQETTPLTGGFMAIADLYENAFGIFFVSLYNSIAEAIIYRACLDLGINYLIKSLLVEEEL